MIYDLVVITREVLRAMLTEACDYVGLETGGVLVGYVAKLSDGKSALFVMGASKGGPNATRRDNLFSRDDRFCQKYLDDAYRKTSGQVDYVGEWHKHPSLNGNLSPMDVSALRYIEASPDYATDQPLFILLCLPNEKRHAERQLFAYTCWGGECFALPLEVAK